MADLIHAIGRRKEAVCRVFVKPGSGKWDVNGRTLGDYFPRPALVTAIQQAFVATDTLGRFDVKANVDGGGQTGQAGALRLAVARALVKIGLCLPRMILATSAARRPRTMPSASTMNHCCSMSPGVAENVFIAWPDEIGPAPHRCGMQPGSRQPSKAFFDRLAR